MQKSETTAEITKAIIKVMNEVVGIEKSMTVGTGNSAYKGVSDKDVKNAIGEAMEKAGLCIVPIDVEPTLRIDRWEEIDQYAKVQGATKQKQSVFTEVKTKYLLMHTSGEWLELSGYGHGTDTQDKAAGKATTYALKYTLLYTFMVPTGKIDDADASHSDSQPVPQRQQQPAKVNWDAELANCKTHKELVELYHKHKAAVDAMPSLQQKIADRRNQINGIVLSQP